MQVSLVTHTPDAERLVAAAARLCYADAPPAELMDAMTPEEIRAFLSRLIGMGHLSMFEHASFTFAVSGVSRSLTHELVRHRIASYSQRSQRYISESGFEAVTPPTIAAVPEAAAIYARAVGSLRQDYQDLLALGIPKEDARFLLPNACASQIVVTMNARSLRHFFALRCCQRAQWEIRALAREMQARAKEAAPGLFLRSGPPCETEGVCREGKLSCGKIKRLQTAGSEAAE